MKSWANLEIADTLRFLIAMSTFCSLATRIFPSRSRQKCSLSGCRRSSHRRATLAALFSSYGSRIRAAPGIPAHLSKAGFMRRTAQIPRLPGKQAAPLSAISGMPKRKHGFQVRCLTVPEVHRALNTRCTTRRPEEQLVRLSSRWILPQSLVQSAARRKRTGRKQSFKRFLRWRARATQKQSRLAANRGAKARTRCRTRSRCRTFKPGPLTYPARWK